MVGTQYTEPSDATKIMFVGGMFLKSDKNSDSSGISVSLGEE